MLQYVVQWRKKEVNTMKKKTAFVLGGGGARGAYEIGVWQALRELGVKIDIVTGTSVGALNGAVVAQDAFDPAVAFWRQLESRMVFGFDFDLGISRKTLDTLRTEIKEFLTRGGAEFTALKKLLSSYLDETAIRDSSVEFGFVTVEASTLTPRCLWKEDIPEGQLLDYILASASCFPAVQSYQIGTERFIDGAYRDNVPVGMALERGATDIIAVDLEAIGIVRREDFKEAEEKADSFMLIQCKWDMGNFLVFDTENTKKLLRLGYLDTLKAYGAYDGELYAFIKGSLDRRSLKGAEQAACIFDLDPGLIYSKNSFHAMLQEAIENHLRESKESFRELRQFNLKNVGQLRNLPQFSQKALVLFLAQRMIEHRRENERTASNKPFSLAKALSALFGKEVAAAKYIAREFFLLFGS